MDLAKKLSIAGLAILLATLFVGCKKSLFFRHAEGKITDITDGTPIPFAQVLIQNEDIELLGQIKTEELATGECDADGTFKIAYKTNTKGMNFAYAKADHYFFISETDKDEVKRSSRKELEIKLIPKTSVLVNFNISDTSIQYVFFQFDPETISDVQYNFHFGTEQKYFEVRGNSENNYTYIIHLSNGTTSKLHGHLFCPKFDKPTSELNISL